MRLGWRTSVQSLALRRSLLSPPLRLRFILNFLCNLGELPLPGKPLHTFSIHLIIRWLHTLVLMLGFLFILPTLISGIGVQSLLLLTRWQESSICGLILEQFGFELKIKNIHGFEGGLPLLKRVATSVLVEGLGRDEMDLALSFRALLCSWMAV